MMTWKEIVAALLALLFGIFIVLCWIVAIVASVALPVVIIWGIIKLVAHFTALILLC